MVSYSQVVNGISKYIDQEIVNKLQGWQRWALGAGTGIFLSKSGENFAQLKENSIVKMLGLIDENGMVDVDIIYSELRKQADKGSIVAEIPALGKITLTKDDVEKLYACIKG